MVEIRRDLWRSSGQTPPAQTEQPMAGCPGLCPGGFWMSPWMETPQPPWIACLSAQSPSQQITMYWCSDNPPNFSLWPLPLILSVGTTEKSLAPSSLHSPFSIYIHWQDPPKLSLGWPVPALSAFLSSWKKCSSPFLIFGYPFTGLSLVCPCLSHTEELGTGPSSAG